MRLELSASDRKSEMSPPAGGARPEPGRLLIDNFSLIFGHILIRICRKSLVETCGLYENDTVFILICHSKLSDWLRVFFK